MKSSEVSVSLTIELYQFHHAVGPICIKYDLMMHTKEQKVTVFTE